jgi:hypothetical protein
MLFLSRGFIMKKAKKGIAKIPVGQYSYKSGPGCRYKISFDARITP